MSSVLYGSPLSNLLLRAHIYGRHLLAYMAAKDGAQPLVFKQAVVLPDGDLQAWRTLVPELLPLLRLSPPAQPLHEQVVLPNSLTAERLLADLDSCVQQDAFLLALAEQRSPQPLMEQAIAALGEAEWLYQHLSVMSVCLPQLYRKTLLCTLLVMQLGMEMRLGRVACQELLWAALAHDIGMLYIAPEILESDRPLQLADWSEIGSHVLTAAQLLEQVGWPASVVMAVYQHQERSDGTGYPEARLDAELELPGQLLALADSAVAIYTRRLEPYGRGWRELVPIIRLAAQEYLFRAVELLAALVARSDLPLRAVVAGDNQAQRLALQQQQQARLQACFALFKEGLLAVGFTHGDRQLHGLQNLFLHVATAYKGVIAEPSGQVTAESASGLQDVQVLQQEVVFHVQRLSLMLQQYLAAGGCRDADINRKLNDCFRRARPYIALD